MNTLQIMKENFDLVMVGKEFYPSDQLLDLVWKEASKDEMFISDAVNGDYLQQSLNIELADPDNPDVMDTAARLAGRNRYLYRKYAANLVAEHEAAFMAWMGHKEHNYAA